MARQKDRDESIQLTKEQTQEAIASLQAWFSSEREEVLGGLAAGMLLDVVLKEIGPMIYNCAVKDMQQFLQDKVEDMYGLMK